MQSKLKLLATVLILQCSISMSAFADNPPSTQVFALDPKLGQFIKQTIFNLPSINEIFSAGKYAWAVNNTTVAFYDGDNWNTAVNIEGMTKLEKIHPGYPLTGQQPIAWAVGENNKDKVIAYFNGHTWSKAVPAQLDGDVIASGGYLWSETVYEMGADLEFVNAASPLTFTKINLPQDKIYSLIAESNNDDTPTYFIATMTFDSNYDQLLRITPQGDIKSIPISSQSTYPINNLSVNVTGNTLVLITHSEALHNTMRFSFNNGDSWQDGYDPLPDSMYLTPAINNRVCADIINGNVNGPYESVSCMNLNNNSPLMPIFNVASTTATWPLEQDRMWYISEEETLVKFHDFNHGYEFDTQINSVANSIQHNTYSPDARVIGPHQIITCGTDKKNQLSGFYFNGTNWIATALNNTSSRCCISRGNADNQAQTAWIFQPAKRSLCYQNNIT